MFTFWIRALSELYIQKLIRKVEEGCYVVQNKVGKGVKIKISFFFSIHSLFSPILRSNFYGVVMENTKQYSLSFLSM